MIRKSNIKDLAIFGGEKLFSTPKSTSNLLQPDINKFLSYSRSFFEQRQYTNNGPNVRLLEKRLAEFHGTRFCLMFSSAFWALALTIRTLAIRGRTEIIMPSLTYRRMADIAAWINLKPHFCEVESNSLAMSAETVRSCINKNTALILGVHPIVNCSDPNELEAIARENKIPILFDSVESVYESTREGKVGGFGEAECFSLHACKLLNGFGGGYLTTNNEDLVKKLASMRSFGFVGVDKVGVPFGLNAKLNEVHAAMTLASLDDLQEQVSRNKDRYYTYRSALSLVPEIRLLEFNENYQSGYKNIVVELLDNWPLSRADTLEVLNAENILARAHYHPPLHRKPMEYSFVPSDLPVTDLLAENFLNLPCGQLVTNQNIVEIVEFFGFLRTNAKSISKLLDEIGGQ